jgi:diguanylate cyclase (GGDEF)-like protein/PAS domain S-box-containing protein
LLQVDRRRADANGVDVGGDIGVLAETRAELLAKAAEASPVGLVLHRLGVGVIGSNEAARRILGVTEEEMLGLSTDEPLWRTVGLDGGPFPESQTATARCLTTGRPVDGVEVGFVNPSGEYRWVRSWASPVFDEDGRLVGASTTMLDITAERAMAVELSEREDLLRIARQSARLGLWVWDISSGTVTRDAQHHAMMGTLPDGDDGASAQQQIHPDDLDRVRLEMNAFAADEATQPSPYRARGADGTYRWFANFAEVTSRDESGRPLRMVGSTMDTTDLVEATERVRELLDSITDGYVAIGRDWTVTYVNRAAEAMASVPRQQMLGQGLWDIYPDATPSFRRRYERAMAGEQVSFQGEYEGLGWFEIRVHPVPTGIAIYLRDITARRAAEEEQARLAEAAEAAGRQLAHAASHDALTGLPNRTSLNHWLSVALAEPDPRVSVLFVDLDRFKLVNDTHGHGEGDALLIEAARRLRQLARAEDIVARLGGDEFVIALRDVDPGVAEALADRLLRRIRAAFYIDGRRAVITASIGIAHADVGSTPETLLRDADTALYRAKDAGRDRGWTFDEHVRASVLARVETESDLRDALAQGRVGPWFQPIFDLVSGEAVGVEALARWCHDEKGWISPVEFVPVAEESGLILPLGDRMLVCGMDSLDSVDIALRHPDARCWVNVSARQFEDPSFVDRLTAEVDRLGAAGRLGVELTESVLSDRDLVEKALHRLSRAGIAIAIDDFGTGYSSLSRLARFPVDVIKIDRSFVAELGRGGSDAIVSAITELAHSLGAQACAEGVEEVEQLDWLRAAGVDLVSGYLLARPVPLEQLSAVAAAGRAVLG